MASCGIRRAVRVIMSHYSEEIILDVTDANLPRKFDERYSTKGSQSYSGRIVLRRSQSL